MNTQNSSNQIDPPSNEPVFWGLFGFGGMVISFALPALILCMLIAGFTGDFSHFNILGVMSHWWGAAALVLIVLGIAFHCVHRIYFSLHDLKLHPGKLGMILFYGFAALLTLVAAASIGIYYISHFE